ncbi:H-NS family nucleoid-associated regulatory protein [Burkholderia sp. Ax-1719]|uniref:H-NS family nucleoid-associated regulatory protein n=1 Tax=Burkholderia sp. Ax-1719 TaxID=2608334 RepID=UPI00142441F7|nr:H-NS family nucleoid-associated regulatory protein [Burkholderia sp. Ax-1719]NIE63174.1 H-NS histone family protein [Burkholderia sp. Ax-1719]
MATLDSIKAKISKLQAQAEALSATKSTAGLTKIRDLMEKHAVTVADIEAFVGKRRGRKPGSPVATQGKVAAKYLDPKSGASWTGRGRAPAWIANVKDRSKFLIDGAEAPAAVAQKAPKAGNYARGPQPALYRNPKTDETWSGRGRAPAWIASAKDRTKFLIAENDGAVAEPTKANAKSAPAKKAAASKSAVKQTAARTAGKTAAKKAAAKKAVVKKGAAKKVAKPAGDVAATENVAGVKKAVGAKKVARKVTARKVSASKAERAPAVAEVPAAVEQAPAADVAE